MASLAEIKKQYPQYAGIPDKDLADALYDKYYKDIPKGDFYKAVGYNESWKEALGRGVDNLKTEVQDPVAAAKNLGRGVVKGATDIMDGGAQLLTRGVAAGTNFVAPGSAADQFMQGEVKRVEGMNQAREDQYQKDTLGSVLAGAGRVTGNAFVPLAGASKVTQAATLPSKMAAGTRLGATAGALQPVYDMDQADASFAGDKALQIGTGALTGTAAPVVSRVGREVASATGRVVDNPIARAAENSLVNERGRFLFRDSVNPAADAQIIKDLANLRQDPLRFQQVLGNQAAVGRSNATGIGADYRDEVANLMKQAGMKDDQILNILNKSQITSADIASLPKTPAGEAAANALTLSVRADAMTKPGVSSPLLAPARFLTRAILPERPATAINTMLGGRTTGEANINNLTTPRSVAAAENVLAARGSPADAIDSFSIIARQTAAQNAAEAEARAAQEAAEAAGKPAREAQRAISEQQATDPTFLLGLSNPNGVPRNARQMQEFSSVIRAQMEEAAKKEADASSGILNTVKDRMGVVNRSGPLRTLEEGFGLDEAGMDRVLKDLVASNPEMKPIVDSLYVSGARLPDKQLYDLSDIIKTATGTRFNRGILNPSAPPGTAAEIMRDASGAPVRSPNLYNAGTERFKANYASDRAMIAADTSLPDPVKKSLSGLYDVLENTGDSAKREAAINKIIKQFPEQADYISQLMGKY